MRGSIDEDLFCRRRWSGGSRSFHVGMRDCCLFEPLVRVVYAIAARKGCRSGTKGQGVLSFLTVLSNEAQASRPHRRYRCAAFSRIRLLPLRFKQAPILVTPGIVGIVGPGNRPEPVEDIEIASIRKLALSGRPVQPWPFLRSGQRVRLQAGPLVGAEGIFLRVKDEYNLVVP